VEVERVEEARQPLLVQTGLVDGVVRTDADEDLAVGVDHAEQLLLSRFPRETLHPLFTIFKLATLT
jgi:hypothetical protein